ncbi:MAG: aconitate hydratase AcnA [Candidatus Puniceispirillum sp.]|nr:aconitate hydratase AcnA [Candidatus Pelagibacter sp.]MBA4282722.1 aconitate hydratase AcnA [Candidatus Puniceispirillum sp.]
MLPIPHAHQKLKSLEINNENYQIIALENLDELGDWRKLPFSLKILLENVYRMLPSIDGDSKKILRSIIHSQTQKNNPEISFFPSRVLMQDFTGVPVIVDLAAMRDALKKNGKDPKNVNPKIPVDLVVDHSVMVDHYGSTNALNQNINLEYERNTERYRLFKWAQQSFSNLRVVPPGMGICHQVNVEYLAEVTIKGDDNQIKNILFPDTVVGTDSHTTMVNALGVLGWGVGGIEAEAAMLGQPLSMLIPSVVGVHLTNILSAGVTATDLVLTITEMLRKYNVVGKFVEFYGEGLSSLSLADRATISNMAPEYGATCGIFGIDDETLKYLKLTGRDQKQINRIEAYSKAQGLWTDISQNIEYAENLELDLSTIQACLAGPKRPQDRILLGDLKNTALSLAESATTDSSNSNKTLKHHDVVIAAITSCTNTSNPSVLIAAGLLAQKAIKRGLKTKDWVKTSFAPGSQVAEGYLREANLMPFLEDLGFHIVGYGCTTCIGNSGPLKPEISQQIENKNLCVSAVLSGNRNFEGRINPHVKANYLASPPLVVAFAIAGTTAIDLNSEPLGYDCDNQPIYLKDIWPTNDEILSVIEKCVSTELYQTRYSKIFDGNEHWQNIQAPKSDIYEWDFQSTYIQNPPYFNPSADNQMTPIPQGEIKNARILALLGDSVTTDHISPAGNIKKSTPAGQYLFSLNVNEKDFNSYGARRGNHQIMMRGTLANIRLQNEMVPEISGGFTRIAKTSEDQMQKTATIFDATEHYKQRGTQLVIFAGKEYGTGSSRDWAAKGVRLLGVSAVIAESFERIHRSNLVGMGVLPLVFMNNESRKTLQLDGTEIIHVLGLDENFKNLTPKMILKLHIQKGESNVSIHDVLCRIDTLDEVNYIKAGGILPYVLDTL